MSICQCQKNHKRKKEIWFKQKTRPRINYEWIEKTILQKKTNPKKINRTLKMKVKLPLVNKKPLARKRILFRHRFLTLI